MALLLETGWSVDEDGQYDVTITESAGGVATTVSIASGLYCHTDIQAIVAGYDDFAGDLKAALEAASPNALTYTVTWSTSAQTYTISVSSGTVSLTFSGNNGLRMRRVLGFSGNQSTAASHTSDIGCFYAITCTEDGPSDVSDEYEDSDVCAEAEADDGSHDGIAWQQVAIYDDYTIKFEPLAIVFKRHASSSLPWTHQHFFEHVRNVHPFLTRNTIASENTVRYIRADQARFRPSRVVSDWDELWDIDHGTRVKGRL